MRQEIPADRYWADPGQIMRDAGMPPDPWQEEVLASEDPRILLLAARQMGKSSVTGALAVKTALLESESLILLLSPTQRQSGELFRTKVLPVYNAVGRHVKPVQETALSLTLTNGSRIVSLPENEAGIRGFSGVNLIIIDEASRVSDDLYRAVRPMLATSNGRLICLSTPFGKRGFFFEAWEKASAGKENWRQFRITAEKCPRITTAFLEEERKSLGDRWFAQEYLTEFCDSIDSVFSHEQILRAMSDDGENLI